tara:strand:- start:43 stop:456 length:414 start_codon:yes stop_codon:yes gene_type:complete
MRKKIIEYFSKKIFKPQKTTGTEVVNPFKRKNMRSDAANIMGGLKVDLAKLKGGSKKLQTSVEDVRAAMRDRARVKKMGGGFAGRRMGYKGGSNGSKKGKVPTTPKEKAFGMLSVKAKKDNNPNITFTDKIVGAKKT